MSVIAVFLSQGGLGDCGQHAVARALEDPSISVRAIAQHRGTIGRVDDEKWQPQPFLTDEQLGDPRLQLLEIPFATEGSAEVAQQLSQALRGVDAVIACPASRQPGKDLQRGTAAPGMRNIIAAMQAHGISRILYVSSIGIDAPPFQWAWWSPLAGAMISATSKAWRGMKKDLGAGDAALRGSGLDYVIVRPMGLDAKEPVQGSWKLVDAADRKTPLAMGIAKADVGRFLLQEALQPTLHARDVLLGQPKAGKKKGAQGSSAAAEGT